MTYGRAKAWVAKGVGRSNDLDTIANAGDAIWSAIQEWNARHAFNFLSKTHTDIPLVSGTRAYDLPSDILHIYSVRVEGGNDQPLRFINQQHWDRMRFFEETEITGVPTLYSLYGSGLTGQILLIPTPDITDNLRIKYFRAITEPTGESDLFDVPKRWVWGILYLAKANLLADHDAENPRTAYWAAKAEKYFQQARADDMRRMDADTRFLAAAEHTTRSWPQDHPYYYLENS